MENPPSPLPDDGMEYGDWEDWNELDRNARPFSPSPFEVGPSRLPDTMQSADAMIDALHPSSPDILSETDDSDSSYSSHRSDNSHRSDSSYSSHSSHSSDTSSDEEGARDTLHSGGLFRSPKLNKPVYEGSRLTLKQHLLRVLSNGAEGKISMVGLEKDLRFHSSQGLPDDNILPATTYQLFQLLGIDVDRFERHACVNGCEAFPHLLDSEYLKNLNEKCKVCKEPRFQQRGHIITPRLKFFSIPLAMQVELLKRDQDFDKSMERMSTEIKEGKTTCYNSFWGAEIAQEILKEETDMLDQFSQILVLSLGLDGVKCFKKGDYSVWPIGIKFWNLHGQDRTRKEFIILAGLIPGPSPPSKFHAFLSPILEEIRQSKKGFLVSQLTSD